MAARTDPATFAAEQANAIVIENADGRFVASFATRLLAEIFVSEGNGHYLFRARPEAEAAKGSNVVLSPKDYPAEEAAERTAGMQGPFAAWRSTIHPDRWYVGNDRVAYFATEIGASGEAQAKLVARLLNQAAGLPQGIACDVLDYVGVLNRRDAGPLFIADFVKAAERLIREGRELDDWDATMSTIGFAEWVKAREHG